MGREPVVRDAAWVAELERQLEVKGFGEQMHAFARSQARRLGRNFIVDDFSAWELVQDVISDTFRGRISWDPKFVDLAKHVKDTIHSRIRHRHVRGEKFRAVRLDGGGLKLLEAQTVARTEAEAAECEAYENKAAEMLAAYRRLAADDPELLRLLECYAERIIDKADVLQASGLSSRQYNSARERLRRLHDRLPTHLQTRRPL